MRVLLPVGAAFERRDQRLDGIHFRLAKDCRAWKPMLAVALLGQLNIDAGRLHGYRRKLHQPFRRGHLAVFQLQPLGFHHSEQLLNDPAKLVPADNLPRPCRKACPCEGASALIQTENAADKSL